MSGFLSFVERRMKDAWIPQDEHYLATILHPKLKHFQMGVPGDRDRAIRVLKFAIEKQMNSRALSSSNSSHAANRSSSANSSSSGNAKTPERKNLLARCFDQASSPASPCERECDDYLNSTVIIDGSEDDADDSE
jgi:hypothetical protein